MWRKKKRRGLLEKLASGSCMFLQCGVLWLTLLTGLQLASERILGGVCEVCEVRECVSECVCLCVCVCVFCKPDIPHPPFTPSTSAGRNVWSASYAGRLCQHSWLTEKEKEERRERERKGGRRDQEKEIKNVGLEWCGDLLLIKKKKGVGVTLCTGIVRERMGAWEKEATIVP